ncbi:MAG: chemotaxis protein CheX [Calditrichaeota bacterium]|nr:chemotaxis protein CheX [Calditrichota bacterium]
MKNSIQEQELITQVFIDSVNNYFTEVTGIKPSTGLPFMKDEHQQILEDYTGLIGISGKRKGFVYFTGPKELFKDIVVIMLQEDNPEDSEIIDMAGETANTVAGNVREVFGNDFMISVPAIIEGRPDNLKFPAEVPVFAIPIKWKTYKAFIVIGLE